MLAITDRSRVASAHEALEAHSRLLWLVGLGFYGVGDTLTTIVGLWAGRGVEVGPVLSPLLAEFGLLAVFLIKAVVLVGFFVAWRLIRSPGRVGIPLALAIVGVAVTGWNGVVLLTGSGGAFVALAPVSP